MGGFYYLIIIAILATAGVLLIGLAGFAKGGDFNRKHANKIMRLRLLLQFIAVIMIALYAFLQSGGG